MLDFLRVAAGGPPDRAKTMEVFRRHGMTWPYPSLVSGRLV